MLFEAGIRTASVAAHFNHFAIRRRFCAVAASKNSSFAPLGPRDRKRSSIRTDSKTCRNVSLSPKRPWRFLEKVE
jgi:hypothetical protein